MAKGRQGAQSRQIGQWRRINRGEATRGREMADDWSGGVGEGAGDGWGWVGISRGATVTKSSDGQSELSSRISQRGA